MRKSRQSAGFTLVELLIVVSIIVVLSSLALVVLRDAQETARHTRTRTIVANCIIVLQAKLEQFETRPIPFRMEQVLTGGSTTPNLAHKQHLRRRTVMEWIHTELPYRWDFVNPINVPSNYSKTAGNATSTSFAFQWDGQWRDNFVDYFNQRPTAAYRGLRDYRSRFGPTNVNENAETLYAILYHTWDNGTRATELLRTSDVADLDGDQCPEIVDAWGEPLQFLVWVDSNQDGSYTPGEELELANPPDFNTGAPSPPELKDFHVTVTYGRAVEN